MPALSYRLAPAYHSHTPTDADTELPLTDAELRTALEREHIDSFGWAVACCRGDRDAAEEVIQNVYLTMLDGRARFDGRSSFRTWLFGVIRVTAASHRRAAWLRILRLERNSNHVAVQATQPPLADAAVECESRNTKLRTALSSLAARQREVLQLVFFHDMTVEEAAGAMGVSVGSARTHYARGKERMATLLGCPEEL
jgi:RNA polymerase sigma-70 factor (ECF subfamily)